MLSEYGVRSETMLFKGQEVCVLGATHAINHAWGKLDRRGERFGVMTQNIAKVGVEKVS